MVIAERKGKGYNIFISSSEEELSPKVTEEGFLPSSVICFANATFPQGKAFCGRRFYMKVAKNFSELIGGTPMLELCKIEEELGLEAKIFAKLEGLNPGGSIKDRVACSMIDEAEKNGMLKPNSIDRKSVV